jgi:hypothetical protein
MHERLHQARADTAPGHVWKPPPEATPNSKGREERERERERERHRQTLTQTPGCERRKKVPGVRDEREKWG